jgi:hypothetical protein
MPSESLHMFDPRRTIQLQGFSGRAATTTIHDATETGFQISGIFQAAEDFANVQLFSAYDYFNHLRVKPLPVTDLSGLTLQYDLEIVRVNSEEGNVRPDCVRYASVGWDKLTITTGAGDIYEVPLMSHAQILSGGFTPGTFNFSLYDCDSETLDGLLVGATTPGLTDTVYVHFMGTRWSSTSAEAIAYCNLETRLLNNIGAPATVLGLPGIQRVLADPDLPGHVFRLPSSLHLLHRSHDLRLAVLASRHLALPSNLMKSYSTSCGFRGAGHSAQAMQAMQGVFLISSFLTSPSF